LHSLSFDMVDIRQTPQYAKYLRQIGWGVERITGVNYFIKKIPLIGSVIKIQRPENIDIKRIQNLAKKYRALQIIIEPKNALDADYLKNIGFRLSRSPYLPSKTLHLDLTQVKEKLFSQLKKDVKYALRKTEDLKLQQIKDVNKFRQVWKKAVDLKRHVPPSAHLKALKKTFGEDSLFLATKDCAAGAIFLVGDKIALDHQVASSALDEVTSSALDEVTSSAYYWQAFSSKEGRKSQAQYKILWEGILWTKTRGAKIFDFEGIYDSRFPNKSWHGFTHFKKSFGGHEVEYPGAFSKFMIPFYFGSIRRMPEILSKSRSNE